MLKFAFGIIWRVARNDLRLYLRHSKFGDFLNGGLFVAIAAIAHLPLVAAYAYGRMRTPFSEASEALLWWMGAFLMFGGAMRAINLCLYERWDFDLLLSSPVPPAWIFLARMASFAAAALLSVGLLALPLLDTAVWFGGARYAAAYLVCALLAVATSGLGLAIALAVGRLLGARGGRIANQFLAALSGASLLLLSISLAGAWGGSRLAQAWGNVSRSPAYLALARAGRGEAPDLASVASATAVLVAAAVGMAALFFRPGLYGAPTSGAPRRAGPARPWTEGLLAAATVKEIRLALRNPALLRPTMALAIGLAGMALSARRWLGVRVLAPLTFLLAILLADLVANAVARDECWDLVRASPAPEPRVRLAKLVAANAVPVLLSTVLCCALSIAGEPSLALLTWATACIGAAGLCWMLFSRLGLIGPTGGISAYRIDRGNGPFRNAASAAIIVSGECGLILAAVGKRGLPAELMLGVSVAVPAAWMICARMQPLAVRE